MEPGVTSESPVIEITKGRILKYAELSKDFNPVHVDEAFAKSTPYGDIIAHGMLSLNVIWAALSELFGTMDYRRVKMNVRFSRPAKKGSKLRGTCMLTDVAEQENGDFSPLRICKVKVACRDETGADIISGEAIVTDTIDVSRTVRE